MSDSDIWESSEIVTSDDFKKYTFRGMQKDAKIWRYMDLAKFLNLVQTRELHFTRIDYFQKEDPFEGSYPKSYEKEFALRDEYEQNKPRPDGLTVGASLKDLGVDLSKDVYLNCWHIQEYESAAMWKIYSDSKGIAIQTTIANLERSLASTWSNKISIGKISYIDYDIHPKKGFLLPYFFKRKSFAYENELRLVAHQTEWTGGFPKFVRVKDLPPFVRVPMDPNILIERICVSPTSESWFKEVVDSINKKYGLNKDVETSAMRNRPLF